MYTAGLVADGWARAENLEKRRTDGRTNQPTDRQPKKWPIELRVRNLKPQKLIEKRKILLTPPPPPTPPHPSFNSLAKRL